MGSRFGRQPIGVNAPTLSGMLPGTIRVLPDADQAHDAHRVLDELTSQRGHQGMSGSEW